MAEDRDFPNHPAFCEFLDFCYEMNIELNDKNKWWNYWLFWLDGYTNGHSYNGD